MTGCNGPISTASSRSDGIAPFGIELGPFHAREFQFKNH